MNLRQFIASTFLLGLTACQHDVSQIQEYPDRWPALAVAADGRCPSLSGTYQYLGKWAQPLANGAPPRFIAVMRMPRDLGTPQAVTLEYSEGEARLIASIHGENLISWDDATRKALGKLAPGEVLIPRDEVKHYWTGFRCLGGWVSQTTTFDGGGNGESGRTAGQELVRFARGEDGSLVAEILDDTQNFQLFGVVQSENHSRTWARFPEISAAERK